VGRPRARRARAAISLEPQPSDSLPAEDTQRVHFGLTYHLPHKVSLNVSYARQFEAGRNANIWGLGITYRFMFPAWPGKSN
jgi:uncharacterized protein with beta-barrel porin domain